LKPMKGVHDIYLVFRNPEAGDKSLFFFGGLNFENK
jgi:hypothetical protein